MAFSAGKYAWGICDISGQRYRLKDMKMQWNGLRVGPDQFDTKQPQLDPKPTSADPQALQRARPTRVALPTPATLNDDPFLTEVGTTVTVTQQI